MIEQFGGTWLLVGAMGGGAEREGTGSMRVWRVQGLGTMGGSAFSRTARRAGGLVALVALVAACSSGDEGSEGSEIGATTGGPTTRSAETTGSTSTTTPAATTTTTAPTTTAVPPTTAAPPPPPPPIAEVDLRAATYRLLCPGGETEVNLRAPSSPSPGGPVMVDLFEPAFGEVTGDGREDAVIHVSCVFADGANIAGSAVVVVSSEAAGPTQIGGPIEGYSPAVIDGRLVVSRAVFGPDDARCCPSATVHVPVRFDGSSWVDGDGAGIGTGEVVTTAGLSALRIGGTYAEIAAAVGRPVTVEDPLQSSGSCVYVSIDSLPDVHALGGDGTVHSIEIDNPEVRTKSGLGVGTNADDIEGAFPGRVSAEPHPYDEAGQLLVFTPAEEPDRLVVFETDGATVTRYRVGEISWALLIEGCA